MKRYVMCIQEFLDHGTETAVQIARRSHKRVTRSKGTRRQVGEEEGCCRIETGNAVTRAALWCRMFTLWPLHDCDSVGLYRRARDVINEVVPPLSYSETLAQLDPLPCLSPLHHITHKRLQSLDHATPRGQPVSCYKRLVPHIHIGHGSICSTLRVFFLSTFSPRCTTKAVRDAWIYTTRFEYE